MTSPSDIGTPDLVTPAMLDQYRTEGYFVLESVLSPDELELLRSGAQFSMDRLDAIMDREGVDRIGINARGKRYFSSMVYQERPYFGSDPGLLRRDHGQGTNQTVGVVRAAPG
jgi:hypothetical protein